MGGNRTGPRLSLVLPFYRKLDDFRRALPCNLRCFESPEIEIVIAADEPTEIDGLLHLVQQHDSVRWRVLVNRTLHAWRPPVRAQNVGIKNAVAEWVLLADPESAFVSDPLVELAGLVHGHARFGVGRVVFGNWASLTVDARRDLTAEFERNQADMSVPLFYGSVLARRIDLSHITGYDESLEKWGADDDNLRIRLMRSGLRMVPLPDLRLLHLSDEERYRGHASPAVPQYSSKEKRAIMDPARILANQGPWGVDFAETVWDWR